jgi:hypothetical protein
VASDYLAQLLGQFPDRLSGWLDNQFAVVLPEILTQEVEAILYPRNAAFLVAERETPLCEKVPQRGSNTFFQQPFRACRYKEIIRVADDVYGRASPEPVPRWQHPGYACFHAVQRHVRYRGGDYPPLRSPACCRVERFLLDVPGTKPCL